MTPFLSQNTHFSTFILNNNGLGPIGGTMVANALLENAKACKKEGKPSSVRRLVCGRNRLENGSAGHWAEAFKAHGGLLEVRMPQNGIRMEGIASLAQGLAENPSLQVLDLQDNTATKTGTRSLVKVLSSWPDLRTLNLSDCLIGSAGGIALATSLSLGTNKKLEALKLQYGEVDKRTVELLAQGVAQHMADLSCVELNGNRFGAEDDCVELLKKALEGRGHDEALDEREFATEGRWVGTDLQSTIWRRLTRTRKRKKRTRKRKRTSGSMESKVMESTSVQRERQPCRQQVTKIPTSVFTLFPSARTRGSPADWPNSWLKCT